MNEHDLTTNDGIIAYLEELTGVSLKTEYDGLPVDVALVKMLETCGMNHGVWFDDASSRIKATIYFSLEGGKGIHGYGETFRDAALEAISAYEQWRIENV